MEWTTLSAFIFLLLSILCTTSIVWWSLKLGITPTPTSPAVKHTLCQVLPESVNGIICEAGCGFGTLLSTLHRHYPSNRIIGLEQSLLPYWFCRLRFVFTDHITIRRINLLEHHFGNYNMVICYLYPKAMSLLAEKFSAELNPHSTVISHTFRLPSWTPEKTANSQDIYKTPVYYYSRQSEESNRLPKMEACIKREKSPSVQTETLQRGIRFSDDFQR